MRGRGGHKRETGEWQVHASEEKKKKGNTHRGEKRCAQGGSQISTRPHETQENSAKTQKKGKGGGGGGKEQVGARNAKKKTGAKGKQRGRGGGTGGGKRKPPTRSTKARKQGELHTNTHNVKKTKKMREREVGEELKRQEHKKKGRSKRARRRRVRHKL